MYQHGARIKVIMHHMITVVWLAAITTGPPECEAQSPTDSITLRPPSNQQSDDYHQCHVLQANSSSCRPETGLSHHRYLNPTATSHDSFSLHQPDEAPPRADLIAIFKLALEEFNILSGLRLTWEYTERQLEHIAVKLKLKGEIVVSGPHESADEQTRRTRRNGFANPSNTTGLLSLITPREIKWNVGMNPEDLSLFVDLHLNDHMSFSGAFGDQSQVGLYFKIPF